VTTFHRLISVDPDGDPQCIDCCPIETQACCPEDLAPCQDLTVEDCQALPGVPQGEGTTCADVECEEPAACCFCDGQCLDLTASDCLAQGGFPGALGSDCDPNPCFTQPCCDDEAMCTEVYFLPSALCCDGDFQGSPGDVCADIECPEPLIDCCLPNCTVQQMTEGECLNAGGTPDPLGLCCACAGCSDAACTFPNGDPDACLYRVEMPELQGEGPDPQIGGCSVCDSCTVPACSVSQTEPGACCEPLSWDMSDCPVRTDCPPDLGGCSDNRDSRWNSASVVCDDNGVWTLIANMSISNCPGGQQMIFIKSGGTCPDGDYHPCPDDGGGLPACDEFCDTGTCCIPGNCVVTSAGPAVVSRIN
jgi:hypothetical protein